MGPQQPREERELVNDGIRNRVRRNQARTLREVCAFFRRVDCIPPTAVRELAGV